MSELYLRKFNKPDQRPYTMIKDPISSLTHFIGFVVSIILTPLLISKAALNNPDPLKLLGCSIYCLSLIMLYGASSAYHSFILPYKAATRLKKFDHISVFILIAGSYTPICLNLLNRKDGLIMLLTIWGLASLGILMKALYVYCPKYISSIIYISLGWTAIFKIRVFYHALGSIGFILLLVGGIMYTIGGIIYALKISINKNWGEHELFHIFVLAGSLLHYLMMYFFVV